MEGQFRWINSLDDGWRKGPWTPQEDKILVEHVSIHGEGRWNSVSRTTGLKRSGKSCRLRWVNYLRPDLKRGKITPHEETIILELHARWGNRWSTIARSLPGRTDNEIKNYWRTHFKKGKPAKNVERARARFRRQQQEEQEQNQKQQQQQQQYQYADEQQQQLLEVMPQVEVAAMATEMQEMSSSYMFPFLSYMFQGGGGGDGSSGISAGEEVQPWGINLWNLDDLQHPDDAAGFGAAAMEDRVFSLY